MQKQEVEKYQKSLTEEMGKARTFLTEYRDKRENHAPIQAFDSIVNLDGTSGHEDLSRLPTSMQQILNDKNIIAAGDEGKRAIFDGIEMGIAEYQHRNGGENPSVMTVLAAFDSAVNACTGATTEPEIKKMLDSLSFGHHEALSVVPAMVSVTIMTAIANSLPIVAMLPNPTGSNEVPLIFGRTTANMRMGVFQRGDYIDGDKAALPYLENRHTLVMKANGAKFSTPVHVGYTQSKNADGTVKFVADETTLKAPFLGGRVVVTVKNMVVASDHNKNHPTFGGTSVLQPQGDGPMTIDGKQYLIKTARADLDNHTVEAEFDTAYTTPADGEVEVQVVFDYERKGVDGKVILTPPGLDMTFESNSVYATPMKAVGTATIDAITQMQNELGLSPTAAFVSIVQQKYYLEQTSRLLREQVKVCKSQANRVRTVNTDTHGVQSSSLSGLFSKIKNSISLAVAVLSKQLNRPVGGIDIFVGMMGAAVFNGLPDNLYKPTNASFGDQSSVYRIGSLNDGTNIYYVPESAGVFNETDVSGSTAEVLILPRPTNPATAPFVGHVAVPPMVLNARIDAFEEQTGVYARMGADRNPNQNFNNQGMLLQIINIPSL